VIIIKKIVNPLLLLPLLSLRLLGLVAVLASQPFSRATLVLWEVTKLGPVPLEFPVIIDYVSLVFSITVVLITGAVLVFSGNYMAEEKYYSRFHFLVIRFVGSILVLIFSPSLISLLMG